MSLAPCVKEPPERNYKKQQARSEGDNNTGGRSSSSWPKIEREKCGRQVRTRAPGHGDDGTEQGSIALVGQPGQMLFSPASPSFYYCKLVVSSNAPQRNATQLTTTVAQPPLTSTPDHRLQLTDECQKQEEARHQLRSTGVGL